jgi:hypothetical protein
MHHCAQLDLFDSHFQTLLEELSRNWGAFQNNVPHPAESSIDTYYLIPIGICFKFRKEFFSRNFATDDLPLFLNSG